ncbi:MAG: NAD-dependent epimerase/dehydratase family protein [Thermoanaerobaculia bacterium]
MHIVVTGGAGFIGSNIADAYVALGHQVTIVDDLSSGSTSNVNPNANFIEADLRDPATVEKIRTLRPDVLCHHAAQIDVRVSVADPAMDAELNIVAALRLYQAALEIGVKKIIFASSGGAIYGEPLFAPQTEEHPQHPMSPYGAAKLANDVYLHYYRVVHGLKSASLRYGNVYGPRQRKDGEAGVVAIFGGAILDGKTPHINGDGLQTRDYVFVGDVVRANVAALSDDIDGIYNVGTGVETSVIELFAAINTALGTSVKADHAPAKKGEQLRSVLDGSKLRRAAALPEPLTLAEGLAQTVDWLREKYGR